MFGYIGTLKKIFPSIVIEETHSFYDKILPSETSLYIQKLPEGRPSARTTEKH